MRIYRFFLPFLMVFLPFACSAQDEVLIEEEEGEQQEITTASKLSFPNAFSPNGDGKNDKFIAKECQNITEFHAYIFNRWGQKLFDWTDTADGWDGTYNGTPVKEGVYFLLCKAKGSDGTTYNIRKDVNLLRGYYEGGSNDE